METEKEKASREAAGKLLGELLAELRFTGWYSAQQWGSASRILAKEMMASGEAERRFGEIVGKAAVASALGPAEEARVREIVQEELQYSSPIPQGHPSGAGMPPIGEELLLLVQRWERTAQHGRQSGGLLDAGAVRALEACVADLRDLMARLRVTSGAGSDGPPERGRFTESAVTVSESRDEGPWQSRRPPCGADRQGKCEG